MPRLTKRLALGVQIFLASVLATSASGFDALTDVSQVKFQLTLDPRLEGITTKSDLQTAVELTLRKAGVSLHAETGEAWEAAGPQLTLAITALPVREGGAAFAVGITETLTQPVFLPSHHGPKDDLFIATTWETGRLTIVSVATLRKGGLEDILNRIALEFVNAWLAAHSVQEPGK